MNRAKGPGEECPGDPKHRRHKQKPKGPQGVGMGQQGPSICVSVYAITLVRIVCVCVSV